MPNSVKYRSPSHYLIKISVVIALVVLSFDFFSGLAYLVPLLPFLPGFHFSIVESVVHFAPFTYSFNSTIFPYPKFGNVFILMALITFFHKNTPFALLPNLLSTQTGSAKGVQNYDTIGAIFKQLPCLRRQGNYSTIVLRCLVPTFPNYPC